MPKKADGSSFLLQLYENGDFVIYHWTPFLAVKGYKTLTPEQAAPLQKLASNGKANVKHIENKTVLASIESARVEGDDIDEERTEAIVDDVVSNHIKKEEEKLDDSHALIVSQDDIKVMELAHISQIKHKSSLERHMLEKYQCEIPVGRLSSMKSIANSMIEDLSSSHRLYLVAGEVKM